MIIVRWFYFGNFGILEFWDLNLIWKIFVLFFLKFESFGWFFGRILECIFSRMNVDFYENLLLKKITANKKLQFFNIEQIIWMLCVKIWYISIVNIRIYQTKHSYSHKKPNFPYFPTKIFKRSFTDHKNFPKTNLFPKNH